MHYLVHFFLQNLKVLATLGLHPVPIYSTITADTDLLKMVPVELLLNYRNYYRTLQLGF